MDRENRSTIGLATLFGALYFVQGIGEPTEGLVAQPVRSLLRAEGLDPTAIGAFMAALSIPWMLKPLYGLVADFVPLRGTHRRSWLLLWTAATTLGLVLAWALPGAGQVGLLWALLLIPTIGIAFSDVVVDALMVETGKPLGLTGRLQSVQWACLYGASIGTGVLGGWLSSTGRQSLGFLICAGFTGASFLMALRFVHEPPDVRPTGTLRESARALMGAITHPGVGPVAVFLFLWSFNPFSTSVQYLHLVEGLSLSEDLYGRMLSTQSAAALVAAVGYGVVARRLTLRWLVHGAIAIGVSSTLAWWGLSGERSAYVVAVLFGASYMVGSLMVMDVAARTCPPAVVATVFALLMSVTNIAVSASEALGSAAYDQMRASLGEEPAYQVLVGIGASFTAACWLLVPWLSRATARQPP